VWLVVGIFFVVYVVLVVDLVCDMVILSDDYVLWV